MGFYKDTRGCRKHCPRENLCKHLWRFFDWELAEARKKNALDQARLHGDESLAELLAFERGLHCVEADVKNLFQGKTQKELEALQTNIESIMLHLQQLGQYLEGEEFENNCGLRPEEQDIEYDDNGICTFRLNREEEAGSFSPVLHYSHENYGSIDPEQDRILPEHKRIAVSEERQGQEAPKANIIRLTYDHDNPPPKFVQGYKFNIFYTHLVDKIQTPRYDVVPDRINGEKCIIKFHAEPPYEDVVR
ncbi:hypothetical protein CUMW_073280 [Citrus unshiu]|nr:hypothetical protein CUMW_073280 [Citrus unshiu]